MRLVTRLSLAGYAVFVSLAVATVALAAAPSAQQALALSPHQKGVDYDRPNEDEAAKCKMSARKADGQVGWIVEGPDGRILRRFVDTNGDNVVDQWSFYKDGIEVYRDIDSNFNGKPDQYRWFHTAGSRWGIGKREDDTIDQWKVISAEEASAELVAALATRDTARFLRITLTPAEAASLGLGSARASALVEKLGKLEAAFAKLAESQKVVNASSRWLQFSGSQPGIVPAGTEGSTADLTVYENVLAVVDTDGKHAQVQIGTLVRMGDTWRAIDVPQPMAEGQAEVASSGFFFHAAPAPRGKLDASAPSEAMQKLLADLEEVDKTAASATAPDQLAAYTARRADLLEKIAAQAKTAEDREAWLRQLADMISAAVQMGSYPDGAKRLESLFDKLKSEPDQQNMAAYVRFRQLMADYGQKMQAQGADIGKLQTEWLKSLEQYVADYPKSLDAAECLLQLGMNSEFSGQEDEAKKWYARVVREFAGSPAGKKAAGCLTRLDLVGRSFPFQGKTTRGEAVDLARYRGKVVLLHFWATWSDTSKAELPSLKELATKYGRAGFTIIGVSLDSKPESLTTYLSENPLSWPQVFEEGGLDSRPANELGIFNVPAMILVDQSGKVVSRTLRAAELEPELKKLLGR